MCGLFAGVGKLNSNRIIALGSLNEERGTDSVGLAYIDNGSITVAKVAERPCVALNLSLKKAVTEAAVSGLFIGHTRQATQGAVNSRNAHPFLVEDIAFAHNGIIFNDDAFGKYEVDSESLIHGIKSKDFSKYQGPIALVWIENGTLKAYRCGNPLYRGKHNGSTYLASEKEYLLSVGCTGIKQLAEGLIYTFKNASHIATERVEKNKTFTNTYNTKWEKQEAYTTWDEWEKEQKQYQLSSPSKSVEDFRTPSDIAKDLSSIDYCDGCDKQAELTEGFCLDCILCMDEDAEKDFPPLKFIRQ